MPRPSRFFSRLIYYSTIQKNYLQKARANLKQYVASSTSQQHLMIFKAAVSVTSRLLLLKAVVTIASVIFSPPIICLSRAERFSDKLKLRRTSLSHSRLAHLLTRVLLNVVFMAFHTRRLLQTANGTRVSRFYRCYGCGEVIQILR